MRDQLAHLGSGHVRQVGCEHDDALRRRVLLERQRDARIEVATAVVENVCTEAASGRVDLGVGRDDADRQAGRETGAHDAPEQEQHEVAARVGVEHIGQAGLAARQLLHRHQGQPPAMGTGYHRAESMSPAPPLPPLRLGYKAAAEQFAPAELLSFALAAERLGLDSVAVSDHFQPFRHVGGHSPASLPWLGALAAQTSRMLVGTSVLTPTYRYHPAVVAQAFATLGCLAPGRIFLGLGSGEAMNEVAPTGIEWPGAGERLERLREAVSLIRQLWTGEQVHFEGRWYRTGGAVIYDLPPEPIPVWIAAGGPKGARFAGAEGGLITTSGKPRELYAERLLPNAVAGAEEAGRDPASIERMIEIKLSYAAERATAIADCRFWAPLALAAEAKQGVDDPRELGRLADELDDEQAASRFICSSDPDEAVEGIAPYVALGFRHLVFHSPAFDQLRFLERFAAEIAPRLRAL
jgi:coenzyme F420-dependent glucose-6-phosphate dehydrogenase